VTTALRIDEMTATLLDNYGATAMFAAVLVALAATVAVIVAIGPRTTGRCLDEINPA
jgi:putative MFS transporter